QGGPDRGRQDRGAGFSRSGNPRRRRDRAQRRTDPSCYRGPPMKSFLPRIARWTLASLLVATVARAGPERPDGRGQTDRSANPVARRLYVAVPGVRNYLEYGGHGLLVFDVDHGHRFVKRIPTAGLDAQG